MKRIVGQAFNRAYRELIADRLHQVTFWVLVGFLPTFLIERNLVSHDPNLFVTVHGLHVHHFTWGVFLLAIVGFVALASPKRVQLWLSFIYGVGLALAFDEFGMWLSLTSQYNLDQSEDVMVGILVFLVLAVYSAGLLRRMLHHMYPPGKK